MKIEFNKYIIIVKKNKTGIMLQMNISTSQIEFSLQSLTNIMEHADGRTPGFEEEVEGEDHFKKSLINLGKNMNRTCKSCRKLQKV